MSISMRTFVSHGPDPKFELENQSPPLSLRHIIHRSGRIGYVAAAATHSYKQFILLCLNIVEPHLKEIYDG